MKTILFVQGIGMTKHEYKNSFDDIASRLHDVGYRTIQFDLPNSEKEIALNARARYVEDQAKKYIPVGLIAQSYGAATVLLASLPTIRSQVLISPALSPVDNLLHFFERRGAIINFNSDTALPRSRGKYTIVGKEFWEDIKEFNDSTIAKKITIPTCILHGDCDDKIPVSDVQTFYNAILIANKKLKIYKGGDHGIVDVHPEQRKEFLGDIVHWFQDTLGV